MIRYVNYLPYGAGYEFSLQPDGPGQGSGEIYRLVEQGGARAVVEASTRSGLVLRTEYALDGPQLSVRHHIKNRGQKAVTVAPVTHPEWALAAWGEDTQMRLRRADGSWSSFALNPERRTRRDLEFAGDAKPAGHWQLIPSDRPFALQETFEAEQVHHTRLVLNQRRGSVLLQLAFNPQTIPPGGSTVVWTTWQFPAGGSA